MAKNTKKKKAPPLSAGRKKLKALGLAIPDFPTTSVGSLPKNQELKELKYKVEKGVQSLTELERKQKLATELWIREQERLGIDILVDGEMTRGDLVTYFSRHIKGYERGGIVRVYGNRYYKKPIIKNKLEWDGPITLDQWSQAQRMTHKPVKAILTGPYTLVDWSFNEHYTSRAQAIEDTTKIIRKEVEALVSQGAKIIQIDEPAISGRPEEFSLIASAIKEITHGIKAYFILHHSYGDLTPFWKKLIRLPIDNFDLEMTNSNLKILSLLKKDPTKKDISVGIIDSHQHVIDTPRQINDRIRAAIKHIPSEQIWFSPDCGLKTRTTEQAVSKLKTLTRCVQKFRSPK